MVTAGLLDIRRNMPKNFCHTVGVEICHRIIRIQICCLHSVPRWNDIVQIMGPVCGDPFVCLQREEAEASRLRHHPF